MVETDFYELLGVERTSDGSTIKSAYRRMAMECHPDRTGGCKENEAKFKAISQAYEVLKDPQKRAAYDRFGHAAFQNGGGAGGPFGGGGAQGFDGFSDIFSSIFGEFMDPRGQRQNAARGADLRYDLQLSLEEAFAGIDKDITVEAMGACEKCDATGSANPSAGSETCGGCGGAGKVRAQQGFFMVERVCGHCRGSGAVIAEPCDNCHGEGRALSKRKLNVSIPAGVDEGTRIRVAGEGESGIRGAGRGDLYLFVHMKPHAIYQRDGSTLVADCPVSFTTAALGGSISLPGIDGAAVEIKIPAGLQSGEQLRHRGSGMSVINGRGRGDTVARVLVETPTRLSKEQKKILVQFRDSETGEECPATKGFFGRVKDMLGG